MDQESDNVQPGGSADGAPSAEDIDLRVRSTHLAGSATVVAVQGHLDPHTASTVRVLRSQLSDLGHPAVRLWHPHVSLAISLSRHVQLDEESMTDLLPHPVALRFSHLGVFHRPVGVVFLGVTANRALCDLHERVHERLDTLGVRCSEWYRPGNWTPHCTLAMPVPRSRLAGAAEAIEDIHLPLIGTLSHLKVVALQADHVLAQRSPRDD